MELRQLASDIAVLRNIEPDAVTRPEQKDLPQTTNPAAEKKGSSLFRRQDTQEDRARGDGKVRNELIHDAPELTPEDHTRLSNDCEKLAHLLL